MEKPPEIDGLGFSAESKRGRNLIVTPPLNMSMGGVTDPAVLLNPTYLDDLVLLPRSWVEVL